MQNIQILHIIYIYDIIFIHPDGFIIIDTPGLRELQLWGMSRF